LFRILFSALAVVSLAGCDGGARITEQFQEDTIGVSSDQPPAVIDAVNLRSFTSFPPIIGCEGDAGSCAGAELFSASFMIYPDGDDAGYAVQSPALVDDLGNARVVGIAADDSRVIYRVQVADAVNVVDLDLLTNGAELYSMVTPGSANILVRPSRRAPAPIVTLRVDEPYCHSITDQRCAASVVIQHYSGDYDREYRAQVIGRIGERGSYRALAQPVILDQFYSRLALEVDTAALINIDAAESLDQLELRVAVSNRLIEQQGAWANLRDIPGIAFVSPPRMLAIDTAP